MGKYRIGYEESILGINPCGQVFVEFNCTRESCGYATHGMTTTHAMVQSRTFHLSFPDGKLRDNHNCTLNYYIDDDDDGDDDDEFD